MGSVLCKLTSTEKGSVKINRLATVVTMIAVVYFGQSGGIGSAKAKSKKASPAPAMKVRLLAWREVTDVRGICRNRLTANMVDVRVKARRTLKRGAPGIRLSAYFT